MSVIVEVSSGPCRGEKCVLGLGDTAAVGSSPSCSLPVEGDPDLASTHFIIAVEHQSAFIFARAPVLLDGQPVSVAPLRPNARIFAGRTRFTVLAPTAAIDDDPHWQCPSLRALSHLMLIENLYALVDGARHQEIPTLLEGCPHESLYEGNWKKQLAKVGPYLVHLSNRHDLLADLIFRGWGRRWTVFVDAPVGFDELRAHFRRYLSVKHPEGRPVYFRFYDPGVLAAFLPACTRSELADFFGPVRRWVVESESTPQLLHHFVLTSDGLEKQTALLFDMDGR